MFQGATPTEAVTIPGTVPTRRAAPNRMEDTAINWSSVSILHDLRNPASTICAAAELLNEMEHLPTGAKRLATNIYRAAERVQELLTDLASIIQGNESTFERCDIGDIITAALETASEAMGAKGIQVGLDISGGIVLPLQPSRMKRVFFNLISNATEALPRGGELHITAKVNCGCVDIVLEDTGPGIPAEIRERLFEPFVTSDKKGWGLGLSLSRQAIRDHGGEIWIEPAGGCRIVVQLPHQGTAPEEPAPAG